MGLQFAMLLFVVLFGGPALVAVMVDCLFNVLFVFQVGERGIASMRVASLSGVMREAILSLCRANVSYSGHVEVDGIICISGQEEGQQIVVKVHEQLFPEKEGCRPPGYPPPEPSPPEAPSLKRPRTEYSPPSPSYPAPERERSRSRDRPSQDQDIVPYVKKEYGHTDRNGEHSDGESKSERKSSLETQRGAIDLTTHSSVESTDSSEHLGLMAGLAESRLRSMFEQGTPLRPHALMPFLPRRPLFQNALFLPAPSPECKACGVFIADPELLQEHNETHHGVFTCRVCYRTFTSRSNLERHSRLHTGHKPYICSKCGKAFSRKDHLTNHSAKHAYKCGKCLKRFVERDALRMHYRNDHQVELSNICSQCNKGFADARLYAEHLKSHPESSEAKAPLTPEEYELKASMFQFKCTECGLTFSDAIDLARHRHLQHMLYSCLSCFQSFADPALYSQHFVTHQSEMNIFECYACRQICQTYEELREHELVHAYRAANLPSDPPLSAPAPSTVSSGPSPSPSATEEDADTYLCPYCAKVYPTKSLLMEHISIHESAPVSLHHTCTSCGEHFDSLDKLSSHEQSERHGPYYASVPRSPVSSNASRRSPSPGQLSPQKSSSEQTVISPIEVIPESSRRGSTASEVNVDEYPPPRSVGSPKDRDRLSSYSLPPSEREDNSRDGRPESERDHMVLESSRDQDYGQERHRDMERDHHLESDYKREAEGLPPIRPGVHTGSNGQDWFSVKNHHASYMVPVPIPSGGFLCSVCGLRFVGFKEYESHCFASHYRYPCMYCPKTFAQRPNRDRHICIHTGEKPFSCPECGQRFSRGDKLKLHRIKTHQLEYPGPYVRLKENSAASRQPNPVINYVTPGHSWTPVAGGRTAVWSLSMLNWDIEWHQEESVFQFDIMPAEALHFSGQGSISVWGLSSRYRDSHYQDKTVIRPSR